MSAATQGVNRTYRKNTDFLDFRINNASYPFVEGDLLFLSSGVARPITQASDCATLLGDAQGSSNVVYHGAATRCVVNTGPHTVKLICRASATVSPFAEVYFSTDAHSFTPTPTVASPLEEHIGNINIDPAEYGDAATLTLVVGQEYEIILRKSYVNNLG